MKNTGCDAFIYRPDKPLITSQTGDLQNLTFSVKDLFHIAGWPTAAGNPDWLATHATPTESNSLIVRLFDEGAELIGKTHTDEIAYSLNGQNIHYGTPLNFAAPDRLPGGSSSGCAASVAQGTVNFGIGTDTGGSIRVPAAYNGLFGIRPTHGLLSMDNMVPLAPAFDTVGWMSRDIQTLYDVASVLLPSSQNEEANEKPLAILDQSLKFSELGNDISAWFQDNNIRLHTIALEDTNLEELGASFRVLQGYEIWQTHGDWITTTKPRFAPDIEARLSWCATISQAEVKQAQAIREAFNESFYRLLEDYLVVIPTTPGAAPLLDSDEDFLANYRNQLMSLTCLSGLSGTPQIHIPMLQHQGAPSGFSFIGSKGSDKIMMNLIRTLLEKTV